MESVTIRRAVRDNRVLAVAVAAMVVVTLACLVGLVVDPRTINGAPAWEKPLKFAISIGIYLATLLWMIQMITGDRDRRRARRIGAVAAITLGGIEMLAIAGQAARGRASHFAVGTAFDTTVWATMGAAITVLWMVSAVFGALLLRERSLPPPLAAAVRWGMAVALLGMAAAFLMVTPTPDQLAGAQAGGGMAVSGAHAVGVPDGGPGLPLVGWSTTGGDLRVGHFVGLHALQGLPLLAVALSGPARSRRGGPLRDERVRARLVTVAGIGWAGATMLLVWQALRAQPVTAPDALTLGAAGALVGAVAAAAVGVVAIAARGSGRTSAVAVR